MLGQGKGKQLVCQLFDLLSVAHSPACLALTEISAWSSGKSKRLRDTGPQIFSGCPSREVSEVVRGRMWRGA